MSNPKFKVGDVVKVKSPFWGEQGTITSIEFVSGLPNPCYTTVSRGRMYYEDELELVTPSLPDATGTSVPDGLAPAPAVTKAQPTETQKRKVPKKMILPADPQARKGIPITTGVIDYFPRALAEVARVSVAGNEQHNPGKPLHWDPTKSTDHADCIPRHLIDRGTLDSDGQRHSAKLAWRALANLELELRAEEEE